MNRWLRVALLAFTAGLVALAVHFDFPLCPLASSLGIPCPGCGLTRATLALLHGDVRTALHFHPLVWLLTPLFVGFVGKVLFEFVRGPPKPGAAPAFARRSFWSGRAVSTAASLLLVLTLSVWLARFVGYFGGPAPVTSMREWLSARSSSR